MTIPRLFYRRLFFCTWLLTASSLSSAVNTPPATPAPATTPATTSPTASPVAPPAPVQDVTLSQITLLAQNTTKLCDQMLQLASPPENLAEIKALLPQVQTQAKKLKTETGALLDNNPIGIEQIRTAQTQWQFLREQVDKPLLEVHKRNALLETALARIKKEEDQWQQLKTQLNTVAVPAEADKSYRKALADIASSRKQLTNTLKDTLAQADLWQTLMDSIEESLLLLQQKEKLLRFSLLSSLQPPIWQLNAEDFRLNDSAIQAVIQQWTLVGHYLAQRPDSAALLIGITIAMLILFWQLRTRPSYFTPLHEGANLRFALISRPYSTTITISVALALLLYPNAPTPLPSALTLLLFIPIVRLGIPQLMPQLRPLVWFISLLFVLSRITSSLEAMPTIQRLFAMLCAGVVMGICILSLTQLRTSSDRNTPAWKAFRIALWLCLLCGLTALLGNAVGTVPLSQFLVIGVSNSAYFALCMAVVTGISSDLAATVLYLPITARSHLLTRYRLLVTYYLRRIVALIGLFLWISFVLGQFLIAAPVWQAITTMFGHQFHLGNMSVSLGDVVAVLFTVWFSFQVSNFVRFIFLEDIAPRTQMERGVPLAIATLMHYAIVLLGFLLAINVAGVDMSKIAIMAGALGVGIGIGLQDVVNNFTSGLILLFEHNIKQADIIQCSNVTGRVETIGLRSSIVKTFDGAEVIVPNSQLVSAQVINWTQSDQERRIAIPVGVAYGSNPEQVIKALLAIASRDTNVLKDPPPTAFFLRFGDSSLDFELRAWVSNTDIVSEATSNLCIAIAREFAEHGIDMPFPQRDIYVRSLPADWAGNSMEKLAATRE